MSTIIIIGGGTPPGIAERSVEPTEDGGAKVTEGSAVLFTCASKEEAICWLEHSKKHPHTACEPE